MPRGAPNPTLEYLQAQWLKGEVGELRLCGHPFTDAQAPGGAPPPRRWYYTLYMQHARRGWLEVRLARSPLKARTWWSVDECLANLQARGVVPGEMRLHPRSVPPGLPAALRETRPKVSSRRRSAAGTDGSGAPVQPGGGVGQGAPERAATHEEEG